MNTPTYLLPPERRPVVAAPDAAPAGAPGSHTIVAGYDGLRDLPPKNWEAEATELVVRLGDARLRETALKAQLAEIAALAETPIVDLGHAFELLTRISGVVR